MAWYSMTREAYNALSLALDLLIAVGTISLAWLALVNIKNQNKPHLIISVYADDKNTELTPIWICIRNNGTLNAIIYDMFVSTTLFYPLSWNKIDNKWLEKVTRISIPHTIRPNDSIRIDLAKHQFSSLFRNNIERSWYTRMPSWIKVPLKHYIRVSAQNDNIYTVRIDKRHSKQIKCMLKENWKSGDQPKD